MDIAPYINAARTLDLFLIGGVTEKDTDGHDWNNILHRSRFLGHGCCRIRPDLWVALFGDRRSCANGVRRFLRATSQEAPTPRRSTSSCGLQRDQQVPTDLDW